MSNLIADIERYYYVRDEAPNTPRNITEGLERDYILTPKADLPGIEKRGDDFFVIDGGLATPIYGKSAEGFRDSARRDLAAAAHLESQATAEARLQERRDKITSDYSPTGLLYHELSPTAKAIVDGYLKLEDQIQARS